MDGSRLHEETRDERVSDDVDAWGIAVPEG